MPNSLFDSLAIGPMHLPNRTVMAPMTRRKSPGGIPTSDVAGYYRRRAEGGVGMIVTEGLAIDHPVSIQDSIIPNIYDPVAIARWAAIARDVQAAGAAFVPQLWHIGGARFKYPAVPNPHLSTVSASGIYYPGKVEGAAATQDDIDAVIASYGRAARAAMDIGSDGVNLHGGHGYLIDGFFWSQTNHREDGYGGAEAADRTRFACEVVRECRRQTRPDFPIMLRFSQFKEQSYDARVCETPGELDRFLAPLTDAGVDIFDCSTRRFWTAEFAGSDLGLAGWTRKLSGKPTMAVGSVGLEDDMIASLHRGETTSAAARLDVLERMLGRGDFDLVGIGRALLSDPDWVAKVRDGRQVELRGFDRADLEVLT
ncbi:1,2-oxophytodienoate reductase [Sphingomonas sp. Leaf357]|uniref:NADH:flavin oxidoreductase n=1 Tax=Sphingomonas sp. Leaf357 TaxID=1736350 RepID=UPI0006F5AD31|nr:NADH:flavin oxidoreductase [Sphingomonas sp. Leaf357]KQS03613.1 1,2-oxophytodienoate reductase [Sphingomonas sp. Leaf357]